MKRFVPRKPGNATITYYRPTYGTARKSKRKITVTWHSEHNKSKATSSPFPSEMIAKLEITQSTANDLTLSPHKQWEQQQTMKKPTTEPPP